MRPLQMLVEFDQVCPHELKSACPIACKLLRFPLDFGDAISIEVQLDPPVVARPSSGQVAQTGMSGFRRDNVDGNPVHPESKLIVGSDSGANVDREDIVPDQLRHV